MSLLTSSPPPDPPAPSPEESGPGESPLVRWLAARIPRRAALPLLLLAGLAVFWPTLRGGFALDDDVHAAMVAGTYPAKRAPWDLYNLVDDTSREALVARGVLPWWTSPALTIRFFRPLASALRWADYALFGDLAVAHHLHSFFWWVLVALGARALYRRLLPARAAALATVAFALAPCHAIPLVWLANREALVSLAFGVWALLAYLRAREEGSMRFGVLAALLFAGAFAAGEYGLALTGYVLAFELVRRGDSFVRRALGLLPFVVPLGIYLGMRSALHYGPIGSGFYADPLRDPALYLQYAPSRFVALLLDGWFALDRETFFVSLWTTFFVIVSLAGLAVVRLALRAAYRDAEPAVRARMIWLLLGSTICLAPLLAVVPSSRLVGVSVLGIAPAVGLVVARAWLAPPGLPRIGGFAGLAATLLAFVHLVHGPISAWLTGSAYQASTAREAGHRAALLAELGGLDEARLVVVRGGASAPFHLPFSLDAAGHTLPRSVSVLAQTGHVLARRQGPNSLELIAGREDTLIPPGEANIYVDTHRVFTEGEVIPFAEGRATIRALTRGLPRIVEFEFDHDLDATPLRWKTETSAGFVDAPPPSVGMGAPYDP
jgi:hypothetical protein